MTNGDAERFVFLCFIITDADVVYGSSVVPCFAPGVTARTFRLLLRWLAGPSLFLTDQRKGCNKNIMPERERERERDFIDNQEEMPSARWPSF